MDPDFVFSPERARKVSPNGGPTSGKSNGQSCLRFTSGIILIPFSFPLALKVSPSGGPTSDISLNGENT